MNMHLMLNKLLLYQPYNNNIIIIIIIIIMFSLFFKFSLVF